MILYLILHGPTAGSQSAFSTTENQTFEVLISASTVIACFVFGQSWMFSSSTTPFSSRNVDYWDQWYVSDWKLWALRPIGKLKQRRPYNQSKSFLPDRNWSIEVNIMLHIQYVVDASTSVRSPNLTSPLYCRWDRRLNDWFPWICYGPPFAAGNSISLIPKGGGLAHFWCILSSVRLDTMKFMMKKQLEVWSADSQIAWFTLHGTICYVHTKSESLHRSAFSV